MQATKLLIDLNEQRNVSPQGTDHLGNFIRGNSHKVSEILVQRRSKYASTKLRDINNLSRNKKFEIIIREKGRELQLRLTNNIIEGLIGYFGDDENNNYHCTQFGRYLFGERPPFGKTQLSPRRISLKNISTGDLIIMKDSQSELIEDDTGETYGYTHVAIYIGEGYYISKLGGGGNGQIVITNFEKLQEIYPYDDIKAFRNKEKKGFLGHLLSLIIKDPTN